ncbi:hypothetical protein WDR94_000506 [Citrobacter amalonaticus]
MTLSKISMAGYPHRPDWISKKKSDQQNKVAHNQYHQEVTHKNNQFPRGTCAKTMVELGWEFGEDHP